MLVEKAEGIYTHFRIPGMVATEKGSLIRYCESRKTIGDWADIDIKVSRSTDCGKSWETVLIIESEGNTLNNPVMFVCGERIILLYCKNYKEIYKRVSDDDGKTFGDSVRVDFEGSVSFFYNVVALGPGHGIYHKGRLIVPAWFAFNREDEKAHHPSFTTTFYSDDKGESWRVGEPIFRDELKNGSEAALAVTAEGEYLISIRHEGAKRTRALAVSRDGISDWRQLRFEENLADSICMGSMTHRNGRIFHINCDNATEKKTGDYGLARINLAVKISDNAFKTCRKIHISDNGGYSDIALLGDKICVLYEKRNEKGVFEQFFETFYID